MNRLKRKVGPLELWQWLLIGTAAGVGVYLYKRKSAGAGEGESQAAAEEKLLGALGREGGGGGSSGGGSSGGEVAAPGPIGLPGEGIPGPAGIAGPPGEPFNPQPIEARVSSLEQQLMNNNPPTVSHNAAAQGKGAHLTRNPANGESYRVVHRNGQTFHEYPHRKGPQKLVRVGGRPHGKPTGHAQKPRPAKRPKPTAIHHRVTVHHAAPKPPPHRAPARVQKPPPRKPAKRRR